MKLTDRDYKLLESLGKWRFLLGNHIEFLCDFPSSSAMYKRLKTLIDNKLIEKQKILFDVSSLYTLAHKGLVLLGLNKRKDNIRIDTIKHNIIVIDTLIYLLKNKVIVNINDVTSEKELHREQGFSKRKHQADFAFIKENKTYCVEVELSAKSIERLDKNIKSNFMRYDYQIWVVEKRNNKIERNIKTLATKYADINILYLEEFLQ